MTLYAIFLTFIRHSMVWYLHNGFEQTFHGPALNRLKEDIADIYQKFYSKSDHYGKMIPLLQSSGTGKSRMMAQLAKEVCSSCRAPFV